MGVLLSLATALLYGSGDFLGGLTSKRNSQIQVLTAISVVGVALCGSLPLLLLTQ